MRRRQFIGGIAIASVGSAAGCLSELPENIEAESQPIEIDEDTAEELGYNIHEQGEASFDSSIDLFGANTEIDIRAHGSTYTKSDAENSDDTHNETGELDSDQFDSATDPISSHLILISFPGPEQVDNILNNTETSEDQQDSIESGIEEVQTATENDTISGLFTDFFGGELNDIEETDESEEITIGDTEIEIDVLEGEISRSEEEETAEAYIYNTEFTRNEDAIIVIGVHPKEMSEKENLIELIKNINT